MSICTLLQLGLLQLITGEAADIQLQTQKYTIDLYSTFHSPHSGTQTYTQRSILFIVEQSGRGICAHHRPPDTIRLLWVKGGRFQGVGQLQIRVKIGVKVALSNHRLINT